MTKQPACFATTRTSTARHCGTWKTPAPIVDSAKLRVIGRCANSAPGTTAPDATLASIESCSGATALRDSILIFGASGFVGSALTRALAERGEKVIAVSRRPPNSHMKSVEVVTGELNQADHFLPLLERSRVVVHAASCSTPGSSAGRPLEELQHN